MVHIVLRTVALSYDRDVYTTISSLSSILFGTIRLISNGSLVCIIAVLFELFVLLVSLVPAALLLKHLVVTISLYNSRGHLMPAS